MAYQSTVERAQIAEKQYNWRLDIDDIQGLLIGTLGRYFHLKIKRLLLFQINILFTWMKIKIKI